jgi:signal transduction histidine kinase/ligand-binding sensor domain-containing protein
MRAIDSRQRPFATERMHIAGTGRYSFALLVSLLASTPASYAERLPITTYSFGQGLDAVESNAAVEDAHGFLWIGTDNGLWRFDGAAFRRFGKEHGLTLTNVTSLALGLDGTLWVGAWGGAFRFDPSAGGSFVRIPIEGNSIPVQRVQLSADRTGRIWCVADLLYQLDRNPSVRFRRMSLPSAASPQFVSAFLADRSGKLRIGYKDLYRVSPDGQATRIPTLENATLGEITAITEDRGGRIWAGTHNGVWRVESPADRGDVLRLLLPGDPATPARIWMVPREAGGVWTVAPHGIAEIDPDAGVFRLIARDNGLAPASAPLLVDRFGDLWLSASTGGIQRLSAEGFSSFGLPDGLEATRVRSIWKRRSGDLVVVGAPDVLQRFDGRRFIATRPAFPRGTQYSWGWFQIDTEDRWGHWWFPTNGAVVRFPPVKQAGALAWTKPAAVYRASGCFPGGDVFRLYEDSRADLWVSTVNRDQETIYRWNRSSGEFSCYDSTSLLGVRASPSAFLDLGDGTLWLGFYLGQIARYRDGRFQCLFDCSGTQGLVNGLLLDHRRRLWIATSRSGVLRVDHPAAESPAFVKMTSESGLSAAGVGAIAEDGFGRIYIGTERGVDVLDESNGRIRHFGVADGLPNPFVAAAYGDSAGAVWFGTLDGLARFTPPARFRDLPRPGVRIDGVRVSGIARPVPATGETQLDGLVVGSGRTDVAVDYIALPRAHADTLRFQYRLGSDDLWSPASRNRSVVLGALSPGNYRIEIRALDASGRPSPDTAILSMRVLAPFYQQSWFIGIAALLVLAAAAGAYRIRTERLVALERQRTRIAMDLHDEIGSRLGSIGLLADLAREDSLEADDRRVLLDRIAESSSDMGSTLGDIVWSLRSGEVTTASLARHLADHARRPFPERACVLDIELPDDDASVEMSLAARRNVFLIGLEALHNAARHSGAGRVLLQLRPDDRQWLLVVADDGQGFDARQARNREGFGLETMARRASEIGASLEVSSTLGRGTEIRLRFDPRGEGRRWYSHMTIRVLWARIRGIS